MHRRILSRKIKVIIIVIIVVIINKREMRI